jgi:hypothetical protein
VKRRRYWAKVYPPSWADFKANGWQLVAESVGSPQVGPWSRGTRAGFRYDICTVTVEGVDHWAVCRIEVDALEAAIESARSARF